MFASVYTVDIKSLHTRVKMQFKRDQSKINHSRTFSTFSVTDNLNN